MVMISRDGLRSLGNEVHESNWLIAVPFLLRFIHLSVAFFFFMSLNVYGGTSYLGFRDEVEGEVDVEKKNLEMSVC